jgi:hypothetical protein
VARSGYAGEPLACDPREQPEVCWIKVQRNEALDELALARGRTQRVEAKAAATEEFWRKYLDGIEEQKKQAAVQSEVHAARAAEAAKGRAR